MASAWLFLAIACILEPIWVVFLDKSDNFKNKIWGMATIIAVLACLYLLSLAVDNGIGPGVAYSILAGIGAVGTVIAGKLLYDNRITGRMVLFLGLVVIGIIGIRLTSGGA